MNVTIEVPIKQFVSFSFTDFVAGILLHPGFEDQMDSPHTVPAGEDIHNVFDGQLAPMDSPSTQLLKWGTTLLVFVSTSSIHSPTNKQAKRVPLASSLLYALVYLLHCDIKQKTCFSQELFWD